MIYQSLDLLAADVSLRRWRTGDTVVLTSMFADPLHDGHLDCLEESAKLGDRLVVVVNGTLAAVNKKGYEFLPAGTRARIVHSLECVDHVLLWPGETVSGVILAVKPDVFSKGGDRSRVENLDAGEVDACRKVGAELALGVGGDNKVFSSSELVRKAAAALGWTPPG